MSESTGIKLSAEGDKLAFITELPLKEATNISLLTTPKFTAVYNNNMTIVKVS